jgi:hypothetical protein
MNNIASIHRGHVSYNQDTMLNGLAHELRLYLADGGSLKNLSRKCHGSPTPTTISRVASGDTKFPRWSTVVLLFVALGFNITAHKV